MRNKKELIECGENAKGFNPDIIHGLKAMCYDQGIIERYELIAPYIHCSEGLLFRY